MRKTLKLKKFFPNVIKLFFNLKSNDKEKASDGKIVYNLCKLSMN